MTKITSTLLFVLITSATAVADSFFSDLNTTYFQLKAPFAKMAEVKKAEPNFLNIKNHKFDGEILYKVNDVETKLVVELSIKGFSSVGNCEFPKLEIKIKKGQVSIFGDNKKIDLNTHCADANDSNANDKYAFFRSMYHAHREVVAYKILSSLGLQSFQTKPIFMSYVDIETGIRPLAAPKEAYQAFFIEDKSTFTKRNGLTELFGVDDPFKRWDLSNQKTVEAQYQFSAVTENSTKFNILNLATIELLQNLIMNNDWFIKASPTDVRKGASDLKDQLWNTKLFADQNQNWIIIAQDFNLSMVSYTELAMPNLENVPMTQKFIGQLSADQKKQLKDLLVSKRAEILNHAQLVANDPKFERIKEFLENRITFLIKELQK